MKETAKLNAARSGLVVIGALAFGYLSLQLVFKPYLEKAQSSLQHPEPEPSTIPKDAISNLDVSRDFGKQEKDALLLIEEDYI
ncbi:hypothetical protein Csa_010432 [Cucumis sativus]|uniref:Uncharacterized protein n=1 Tax=Cucumis sativus TaxID=3659 RepID=A0A0A0L5N1_CUCSA|nr:hypothetical protein Csa_010432 [Cucumis sativus]